VSEVRVLVVDDSPAIRTRLATLMRDAAGVEVAEAPGADEALEHLRAHGADVVVLDVHMPGRSGLDVLPEIKASPGSPLVIVLTSHPTEHHRRQCLAQGADYFFDKSRDFARVVEVLVRPTASTS
jgi:two-component system response regulator DevR